MRTSGGYTMSINRGVDAQGAAINAEIGLRGITSSLEEKKDDPFVIATVRTKVTRDISDVGLGLALAYAPPVRPVSGYFLVGVNALQLGVFDRQASFGMFGPFGEAGIIFSPTNGFGITLGPSIQYDIRFTTSSQAFWGANLGLLVSTALRER